MDTTSTSTGTGMAATLADKAANLADKLPDRGTVDRAAQSAHDAIDRVAAKAGPALDKMRASVAGTKDTLRAKADQLGELQDEWLDTTRTYVRENPMTALAIGVLVGAVLAKLASSSR